MFTGSLRISILAVEIQFSHIAEKLFKSHDVQELPQHAHLEWILSRSQDYEKCEPRTEFTSGQDRNTAPDDHIQIHGNSELHNAVDIPAVSGFDCLRPSEVKSHMVMDGLNEMNGTPYPTERDAESTLGKTGRVENKECDVGTRAVSDTDGVSGRFRQHATGSNHTRVGRSRGGTAMATGSGYDGCVTLAITTCRRIQHFMGTVAGLQVCVVKRSAGGIV